ncbi:MAG: VacB/RNase II family 3'-5' exoribonuclease [Lentisphaeria bacterium]|nr:VacB/RNase II family 3'-5' exoribonuclease [Lentisphaeria bacterium]
MKKHKKNCIKEKKQKQKQITEGIFSAAAGGFGFVACGNGKPDIFIPAKFTGNAIHGDKVSVTITDPQNALGPAGEINAILERSRKFIVGELREGRILRPLDEHFHAEIKVTGSIRGVRNGDWIKVRLLDPGTKFIEKLRGSVVENYGPAGSIAADLKAVASEFELPPPYSEAQNRAAARLKPTPIHREDLRKHYTITVDPADAKDFDDAISITPGSEKGTLLLGVHIADVAAWVHPDTKTDRNAAERGFSAYLPGMFLPMLPGALTSLISLRQGVDSRAHSILFTVREKDGKILNARRVHSIIQVDQRLDYDELQEYIEHPRRQRKEWSDQLKNALHKLIPLIRKLRKNRKKEEHFLHIETTDIRVLCDSTTMEITGLRKNISRESEQLVEECMLAANSAVATEMIQRQVAGLYRVHQEPDPEKLMNFSEQLDRDFRVKTGDLTERANCEHFLENLPDDERKPVIISAFLRSLPRACYDAEPALHYGLGKYRYSHFTSPIRRYTDLLTHRQLWAIDTNTRLMSKHFLKEAAKRCSEQEEIIDNAGFAANDRLKLHYLHLQDDPDADYPVIYEAVIAKTMPAGMLCDIHEMGIYGFIPTEKIAGNVRYHKNTKRLKAERGHNQYKCGDVIFVVLDSLDFIRGRAVFRPV